MAASREHNHESPRLLHTVTKKPQPLEPAGRSFNNLPAQVTSLIGRAREIQEACELLLRPGIRLVTMTGTGGIGKTRLALACAQEVLSAFKDETCFVSLASVTHSDFVLPTLLQTLGIKEQSDVPLLASLKSTLQDKQLLLLLDNIEHLVDAAPLLLDLLHGCPDLKLLITSRAILHIPGEHVFPVPPLAVPDARWTKESGLLNNPALALFVERARALKPDFRLTTDNAPALVAICRQLAGLPLALELAAARVNLLSPQQLLARLTPCLDILSDQGNTMPSRHQTIRQTIEWSYNLLNAQEQQLLCRLSVFVEGCDLADIEAFYILLEKDSAGVLNGVGSLLDKSLLFQRQSQSEEPRLDMLESIRNFGEEMLLAQGQLEHIRATHATYYASLVPEPEPAQLGLAQGEWLARLEREYKNILAALHFFQEKQQHTQALQLAIGIGGIWFVNGYGSEGQQEMARALELYQEQQVPFSPALLSVAFALAAGIAIYHSDFSQAKTWYWASLPLCRQTENNALLALTIAGITLVETDLGNYSAVESLLDESIAGLRQSGPPEVLPRLLVVVALVRLQRGLFQQAQADAEASIQLARIMPGQEWSLACALYISGWVEYLRGSWITAHTYGRESIEILRKLGFPVFALEALCLFASETAALGDLSTARTLFEEALALSQEASDTAEIGRAYCGLGYLALRNRDFSAARQRFEESLKTMQQIRQPVTRFIPIPASSLEGLAVVAISRQKAAHAAVLLGVADTLRRTWSYEQILGRETFFWEQTRQAAITALGAPLFNRAFNKGKHLTPQQAADSWFLDKYVDEHIHAATPPASDLAGQSAPARPQTTGRLPFGEHLTKRELDVMRLLAEGLTNSQIAEKLVLSVVTVNSYLRAIYGKLDVSSRTAAIRYAWDHHLI